MNREIKKAALAAAVMLLAKGTHAAPLSWTEIGVAYDRADSGDETVDAYEVRGSIGLFGWLHGQLNYVDGGEGGNGPDFDGYELRVGFHPNVAENTQAVIDVLYFDYSGDDGSFSADEDGYGFGFGVRHKMGDKFEVRAQADWYSGTWEPDGSSFDEDFENTTYSIGGRYYWSPLFFTGVSVIVNGMEAQSVSGVGGDVLRIDAGLSFGDLLD